MLDEYSKQLMKLTPFQIITDKVRENYASAILYELRQMFVGAKERHIYDDETVAFKISRRGDLDVGVAMFLTDCCGVDSVLVETEKNYRTFIVNVKSAYDYRVAADEAFKRAQDKDSE